MLDELHRALQASPAPVLGLVVTGTELDYHYSYGPYSAASRAIASPSASTDGGDDR